MLLTVTWPAKRPSDLDRERHRGALAGLPVAAAAPGRGTTPGGRACPAARWRPTAAASSRCGSAHVAPRPAVAGRRAVARPPSPRSSQAGQPVNGRSPRPARRRARSTGRSTASPSFTPPREPGRLTTRQGPATPASPRESTAVGTPAATPCGPDRLGDPGDLAVQQRAGDLRGAVGGGEAGAAGGQHHAGAALARPRRSPRPPARRRARPPGRPTAKPELCEERRRSAGRSRRRTPRPRRGWRRRRPRRAGSRRTPADQSPDLPPVLVSTRTSVITAPLSTALTMSTTVSAGDRDGGQRLHLDAGAVGGAHGGEDLDRVVGDPQVDGRPTRARAGGTAGSATASAWRP